MNTLVLLRRLNDVRYSPRGQHELDGLHTRYEFVRGFISGMLAADAIGFPEFGYLTSLALDARAHRLDELLWDKERAA